MLDPNSQAANDKRLSILPLLAVVLSLCFSHIHQGTLSIDGIRYASIASYIEKTGELFRLVDDYSGVAYANKPPVLFWLVALSFKVFGFSTFAAKLPGAMFAALAMTLFFFTLANYYGRRIAYLGFIFFIGNRTFFRSVVDINFEGMTLSAALCVLYPLIGLMRGEPLNIRRALMVGFGVMLFCISKPPYLLLILPAILYGTKKSQARPIVDGSKIKALLAVSFPLLLGLSWLPFVPVSEYLPHAVQNQIIEPLTITLSFRENFSLWLETYFLYFAPISVLGPIALLAALFWRGWPGKAEDRVLYLWAAPIVLIMLFTECRTRYLLIPLISFAILIARLIGPLIPLITGRFLELLYLTTAIVGAFAALGAGHPFHKTNEIVFALRSDPALLENPPLICAGDGTPGDIPHPEKRRTAMLLELEFGRTFDVVDVELLNTRELPPETLLLADEKCGAELRKRGLDFTVIREFEESRLLKNHG